jgi:hypothetical protein
MKEHAFPSPVDPKTGTNQLGMTLRDYFASKVLQSLLDNKKIEVNFTLICQTAYSIADKMMEARK